MTNQEAMRHIDRHNKVHQQKEPFAVYITEAFEMAQKALKKQTPQKVTHEATLYKCCTCPNCGNVVDKFEDFAGQKCRVTYQYCHFCGQALDWSDETNGTINL